MARKPELGSVEYWREAYHRLWRGRGAEVRLDSDGTLDEIVGHGGIHIEQLDTNHWFVEVAGCRFNIYGKQVKLVPIEVESWQKEQERLSSGD